ncbi:site-specific DNA-methyltransferase [Acinetobacter sp. RIT592]|jgi:adenine-specific DNA-methyltransferase|nr:site-specific DNA-methyltransferase [Acinetobacter sp. RIT592]
MDKLDGKTFDVVSDNIKKLEELFPEIVTEGSVDVDKLALLFDKARNEDTDGKKDGEERYEFTWKGKKEAIRMAQKQTTGTLRPCKEESVNFDETQNLYIEGDNLEVLRALQSSYRGKIKMIYIDPPYNTGKDFVYKDSFNDNIQNYKEMMNESYKTNTDASGRFHTNWLNMMYPRLKLAKNLLSDDGAIFISLDDNEITNLKKICDEVFGEVNFVEQLVWKRRATAPNDRIIGRNHEYVLIYAKNINNLILHLQPRSEDLNSRYKNPDNDPKGRWVASDLSANGKGGRLTESCVYGIKNPKTNQEYHPPQNKCWLYNKEKMNQLLSEGRIGFRETSGTPFLKRYLAEVRDGSTLPTIIDNGGFSQDSAKEIKSIFEKDVFEFPKPTSLIKILLTSGSKDEDIILDFFSGSCSTAHAVIQLNAEDGVNRKFIMVQLPEKTDEKSEAYKAGYKNICEIGKERIRRAGKKIIEENKYKEGIEDLDIGFKVFKLDTTNIKEWDDTIINTDEIKWNVEGLINPIKEDRSQDDVIYEILLKYGADLTMPIEEVEIMGSKVYSVGFGYLMICLEKDISLDLIEAIGEQKPNRVVLYDNGLDNESKTNGERILKELGVKDIRTI